MLGATAPGASQVAMMMYRYTLDILKEDGSIAGSQGVEPCWERALECLHLEAIRRGELPLVLPTRATLAAAVVEPCWHPEAGRPYVQSFAARFPNGNGDVGGTIPLSFLRDVAEQASKPLVDKGALQPGESFKYVVSAFPTDELHRSAVQDTAAGGLEIEEIELPLPAEAVSLADVMAASSPASGLDPGSDMPLFVCRRVIDEAVEQAVRAGDYETGAILIGKLYRDRASSEIFVVITAQIPLEHTVAATTKLTITPESWAAAQAAIDLRGRGEQALAWQHAHQDLCRVRGCPVERRRLCPASKPFLSADDVLLHATCFGRAYQCALLISDHAADGRTATMFGWRDGRVAHRGYHLLDALPAALQELPHAS